MSNDDFLLILQWVTIGVVIFLHLMRRFPRAPAKVMMVQRRSDNELWVDFINTGGKPATDFQVNSDGLWVAGEVHTIPPQNMVSFEVREPGTFIRWAYKSGRRNKFGSWQKGETGKWGVVLGYVGRAIEPHPADPGDPA